MAAIVGRNFRVNDKAATFFGLSGRVMKDGKWDAFIRLDGRLVPVVGIDPEPVVGDAFQECVAQDIKRGLQGEVAMVFLDSYLALSAFLEGLYTKEHFREAKEGVVDGLLYIDVPQVTIAEGYTVTVRIFANFEPGIATANAAGNIL